MKKSGGALSVVVIVACLFGDLVFPGNSVAAAPGEALFKQFCSVCHVDGGNVVNSQKTLRKKDLDANNVKTAEDIIKRMRDPGPGMTKFNDKTLSAKQAKEIASYVLDAFK